jgi:hypothetical protein
VREVALDGRADRHRPRCGYARRARSHCVRATGEVYFDVVTTLVFLLLAGRYL